MKKQYKLLICMLALCSVLTACGMMGNDAKDTQKTVDKDLNKMKDDTTDSIDNMMNYFKDKGIKYEGNAKIDKIDFAAYEGSTFNYKGSKAYLYRVKSNDEQMQRILKEAKEKGRVKVSIDNMEQEYAAKVNGSFLLLYDMNADMTDINNVFPNYVHQNTTQPNDTGNQNTNNPNGKSQQNNRQGSSPNNSDLKQ